MRVPRALSVAKELQLELSSQARALYFHGESMRPFLVEGDEVVVEPVAWGEIRIGDVITYRYLDRFPTRRVVRRARSGLHLWCESWPERQFWAARENVLGRAVARRRGEKWIDEDDPEWRRARRAALIAYWRRYGLTGSADAARRAVRKLLRLAGLRAPHPARPSDRP